MDRSFRHFERSLGIGDRIRPIWPKPLRAARSRRSERTDARPTSNTLLAFMSTGARPPSSPAGVPRNIDSHALWRVFCGDKEGVAVQTTVGRLETHFGNIELRKVKYAEPKPLGRTLTIDDVTILKRPFFDFEKEARAILRTDTNDPNLDKGEFDSPFPSTPPKCWRVLPSTPRPISRFMKRYSGPSTTTPNRCATKSHGPL